MSIARYFVAPKEAVKVYPDGREVCDCGTKQGRAEYHSRTVAMADRQGRRCAMCDRSLYGYHPSFDHEAGRGHGGAHRDDRIEVDGKWHNAALCHPCNGLKGSKRYHWKDGEYVPKEQSHTQKDRPE